MGQTNFGEITCRTHKAIVHKFNTGGVKTCFNQIGNKVNCFLYISKYCKDVNSIGAQGQQLQGCFGDNTQGAFATHYQLVKTVACAALLQTITQLGNFAGRSNYFNAVNLVAGSTVTHSLVTACVSSNVTANQAAICTAGVTCIKEACLVSHLLNFNSASASFNNHVHSISIQFNNFVHAFQQQNDTTVNRNCATGNTSSCTAGSYGNKIFIGNFHNCCYLFGATGQYYNLRQMMVARVSFFVSFVAVKGILVNLYVFSTKGCTQGFEDFFGYGIVCSHYIQILSFHF